MRLLVLVLLFPFTLNAQFSVEIGANVRAVFNEITPIVAPRLSLGYRIGETFIIEPSLMVELRYRPNQIAELRNYRNVVISDVISAYVPIADNINLIALRTENIVIQERERVLLTGIGLDNDQIKVEIMVGVNPSKVGLFTDEQIPEKLVIQLTGAFLIRKRKSRGLSCPKWNQY